MQTRLSRFPNKNGHMERNNGIFESILERLCNKNTIANDIIFVARAHRLASIIHGSSVMSAFRLTGDFSPSIFGLPFTTNQQQLLEFCIRMSGIAAIQKKMPSRTKTSLPPSSLSPVHRVSAYHSASKQQEPVRWLKGTVEETFLHMVKCKISQKVHRWLYHMSIYAWNCRALLDTRYVKQIKQISFTKVVSRRKQKLLSVYHSQKLILKVMTSNARAVVLTVFPLCSVH